MSLSSLLILLISAPIFPLISIYLTRLILRGIGVSLQLSTRQRKETILSQVRRESVPLPTKRQAVQVNEDDDWERIDGYQTPSAPNGGLAQDADWDGIIGFFHPFCNAGGGGERVLWAAIRATQTRWPKATCVVYSGDHDVDRSMMIKSVRNRFGIRLHASTLHFIYLTTRHYVQPSTYPHLTLLGQSLGSVRLAYEAFGLLVPDIFIDTMGYAFTLAFCKYLFPTMPVGAYVHYPTISTDMLESLDDKTGERGLNSGAGSGPRGTMKKTYWKLFARLYGWVGSHIDVVMCNSSWTLGHISRLWKLKTPPAIIYPPCAVEEFEKNIEVSAASEKNRLNMMLYIAQFRPEKNHSLILRSFAKYFHTVSEKHRPRLILIGSVRQNTPDEKHVYNLRLEARELKIDSYTTFITDAPLSQITEYLQKASIGVNGMWNEHFGIGIVEYLAAGLIPVVHASGGPKLDIVTPFNNQPTGFLAETDTEFAEAFAKVLAMAKNERLAMRLRGRESAKRFSEDVFAKKWVEKTEKLIKMKSSARV